MQLISVVKAKNGWKIEYEGKAEDKIPVKIKYPSVADIGLGQPTRSFLQAIAKFLRIAIAISHLDKDYWIEKGQVVGVKFKEGKDDRLVQITLEADDNETILPCTVTTNFVEFFSVMGIVQSNDPTAPSLSLSVTELEAEVSKYISGDRYVEQLELLPTTEEALQTTNYELQTNS